MVLILGLKAPSAVTMKIALSGSNGEIQVSDSQAVCCWAAAGLPTSAPCTVVRTL